MKREKIHPQIGYWNISKIAISLHCDFNIVAPLVISTTTINATFFSSSFFVKTNVNAHFLCYVFMVHVQMRR